tara:strand:- start:100 stop:438 length:339 start_codon:yes stop_codon:yes gene_type:complete
MGYRSQVAVAIGKKHVEDFQKIITNEWNYKPEKHEFSTHTVYVWDWVKWYDGYDEVDAITEFIDELDEGTEDIEFLRIGEETGDIELRRNGPHTKEDYWLNYTNPKILVSGD